MEVAADESSAAASIESIEGTTQGISALESFSTGYYDEESPPQSAKPDPKAGMPKTASKTLALREMEQDWAVYSESNYSFEFDSTLNSKWGSGDAEELFRKRQEAYLREGTRRSVAAVFLVHRQEYPHVLLLLDQQQQRHSLVMFKYKTWQRPREVLHDKLLRHLIKPDQSSKRKWVAQQLSSEGSEMEVGEFLGEWWRGEFDDELIPYLPPHVTRPKERVRVHQVQLSPRCSFRIPTGFCLTAVPIFDLSPQRQGLAISGLSHVLARFSIRLMLPTSDKYEAVNSLEHREDKEDEMAGSSADASALTERPEVSGVAVETEPADEQTDAMELLPPELQHLAELEETT